MLNEEKRSRKQRLGEELKKLSIVVIYLWVLLTVFSLHRAMILAEYGISYNYLEELGFALVNGWIMAKSMLIAEALHAGEQLHSKPLLHSILFKSAVFSIILMVCHTMEQLVVKIWHERSFPKSLADLSGRTLNDMFSLGLIVFVVLIPFFAAREFSRVLGRGQLKSLLLRRGTTTVASPSKSSL